MPKIFEHAKNKMYTSNWNLFQIKLKYSKLSVHIYHRTEKIKFRRYTYIYVKNCSTHITKNLDGNNKAKQ